MYSTTERQVRNVHFTVRLSFKTFSFSSHSRPQDNGIEIASQEFAKGARL